MILRLFLRSSRAFETCLEDATATESFYGPHTHSLAAVLLCSNAYGFPKRDLSKSCTSSFYLLGFKSMHY